MFTDSDKKQISEHGLSLELIESQVEYFKNGFPPAKLIRPALVNDGILKLTDEAVKDYQKSYSDSSKNKKVVKFVPASGAASRMFKKLFAFHGSYQGSDKEYEDMKADNGKGSVFEFFKSLESFAFYNELKSKFDSKGS